VVLGRWAAAGLRPGATVLARRRGELILLTVLGAAGAKSIAVELDVSAASHLFVEVIPAGQT